ncbi:MAG: phosphatidylserine decarboxylase [Bdellovibrionales bacterium]|nr:phosphatidylserine decarboxylase [Bdellovibrionales bacterium]
MLQFLFSLVPKNLLSATVGALAQVKLPARLATPLLGVFSRCYGINFDESKQPLTEFKSLSELFLRDLKPWVRPIDDGVVSPVDGRLTQCGPIEDGCLVQVKGKRYSVASLLKDESSAARFRNGYYITIYLAPGDYHHIHAPVDGRVVRTRHIEGALWPVNEWSLERIDELFAVNERVVSFIESSVGMVALVMVGATNVGSIRLSYSDLRANQPPYFRRRTGVNDREENPPIPLGRGERIASFHLGSSIVLLFEPQVFRPGVGCRLGRVRYGERLDEKESS